MAGGSNPLAYDTGPLAGKPIPGMVQRGNIDVNHRPGIANADGSHSSIFSMTVPVSKDGSPRSWDAKDISGYALVPSIANGKFLTPDGKKPDEKNKAAMEQLEGAATDYYNKTRQHLGVFKSDKDADTYAGQTHAWVNDGSAKSLYAPSYAADENGEPVKPTQPSGRRVNPMAGASPKFDPRGSAAGPGRLNGVPAFARNIVDWSQVKEKLAPPDGNEIASVNSDDPTTIRVSHPDAFTPALRGHEATHVAQWDRSDGVNPGMTIGGDNEIPQKDYSYGGMPGLRAARAAGKTMADFNREQQATMVQDYISQSRIFENAAKKGKLEPGDLKDYAEVQEAYHPFIKQLAAQPEDDEIDTHPEPPGLPPADTPGLGMMKPDPLLGGDPIATDPQPKHVIQNLRPSENIIPTSNTTSTSDSDGRSAHDRLQEVTSRALSSLPAQLQRHLTSDKVNFAHGALEDTFNTGRPDYAGVVKGNPHTIMFDNNTPLDDHTVQQLVAHEGVHIIQHNLPPEVAAKIPADDEKDPYNYGGAQGLINLRQQNGTILSLPREKQAAAVQYYVSQRPHVTGQAAADMDAAYKPYLDDLDKLPQSTVQPTSPDDTSGSIVTAPRAPTPPPEAYGGQ